MPSFVVEESIPRFAVRSIPLQKSSTLPASISKVTLRYPGRHSLATVAEMISRLINIPVVMTPDALMDAARFSPGTASTAGGETSGTAGASQAAIAARAAAAGALSFGLSASDLQNTIELDYSGNLAGLLDQIAVRAGLYWQYMEGRIVFSRIVTRAFTIKALPNGAKVTGSLKLSSGGGSEGGSSGSSGDLSLSMETESDIWASLSETVKGMVSASGRAQIDAKSGMVTVTDALTNVEKVEHYIQSVNAGLLRQVSLEVEVLQVSMSDEYSHGINWNAVMGKMRAIAPGTLGTFSGNDAGSLAFVLPAADGRTRSGQLFINALQEYGKVGTAYSGVVTTVNRMPVPVGSLSSESYLKQTTPLTTSTSSSGSTTAASVGLTPGTVTTGFSMVVLPIVLDSNRVLLQSTVDISSLRQLKTISSGSGAFQQTIQLPSIDRFSTMQRMSVRAGETLVLVGYEREATRLDSSDIERGIVPLARRGSRAKESTVILITPRLTDD